MSSRSLRRFVAVAALLLSAAPLRADEAEAARLLREAEDLVADRDFAGALARAAEAQAAGPSDRDAKAIAGLREDAVLARDGLARIAAAIRAHPDRFKSVEMNRGSRMRITGADEEGVDASFRGGTTRLPWASMRREGLAALAEAAALPAADLLPVAALLWSAGADTAAEGALVRLLEEGRGDRRKVSRIFARWIDEDPPAEGYVAHEGLLVRPEDADRLGLEEALAAGWELLQSDDAAERDRGYEQLRALGEPARWSLWKALRTRRDTVVRNLLDLKAVRSSGVKQRLKVEVEKRRAEALKLIEDPQAYPYPNKSEKAQAKVNELVAAVRVAWETPGLVIAEWIPDMRSYLDEVEVLNGRIAACGVDGAEEDLGTALAALHAMLDVPGMFASEYDAKVLEYNREVDTTAGEEERENVRCVNEYRIMMGRQAVKINERLVRAARGHSRHMRLNNYFSHDCPIDPELATPGKRAKRQGYGGGVGENIQVGRADGTAAFWGWFHSSGHHRNMVNAGWTELGAGRSGAHFTQKFGRAGGKSLKHPEPLPPPEPDVAPDAVEPTGEAPGRTE